MIKIEKASAGSGKTYMLSHTYQDLLKKPFDYRHILAVTFTNKATAEMKERILRDLYDKADSDSKARAMLTDILHDYSAFSVNTIDTFFQRALRSFARELGQMAEYRIELDRKAVIHEAMDRVLDSLSDDGSNAELLEWLRAIMEAQLMDKGKVGLEAPLYKIGENLKNNEFRNINDGKTDFSRARLNAIRKSCESVIEAFHNDVKAAAATIVPPNKSIANDLKKYLSVASVHTNLGAPGTRLQGGVVCPAFFDLFEGNRFKWYKTAHQIIGKLAVLGISGEFLETFDTLLKEKGIMCLDESNGVLKQLIAGSDAPFVYEKMGVRYTNFLLDEFQDTSNIQWDNFLPLLIESESNNNDNLIVGDVKQSIYRWRDSDWSLLGKGVKQAFPSADEHSSEYNWRSVDVIRSFNNDFFLAVRELLGKDKDLYADVVQKAPDPSKKKKDPQDGYVKVSFCAEEKELEKILESIETARQAGAGYGDITILVRGNDEGSLIAKELIARGIGVVSVDSLNIANSTVVNRLVALLSAHAISGDSISAYLVDKGISIGDEGYSSLVELCERILRKMMADTPEIFKGESLYINAFMDAVRDWQDSSEEGLRAFLNKWKSSDHRIGTPDNADSVRILTVHKAKGLESPYVIFPFVETVTMYSWKTPHWCWFDAAGTPFSDVVTGPYSITLSNSISDTVFNDAFEQEKQNQLIDNLNVMYVALTRPKKCLHLISAIPEQSFIDLDLGPEDGFKTRDTYSSFAEILYQYCSIDRGLFTGQFEREYGKMYDFTKMPADDRKEGKKGEDFICGYSSFDIGKRLILGNQSKEFFEDLVKDGLDARQNGTVLHGILAKVYSPSDLDLAVSQAVEDGLLGEEDGRKNLEILRSAIAAHPEFFPAGAEIRNEEDILDVDETQRPDRVIIKDGAVTVVDYKFGKPESGYPGQVRGYMDLYRKLGYNDVTGYLWYVYDDKVEQVTG